MRWAELKKEEHNNQWRNINDFVQSCARNRFTKPSTNSLKYFIKYVIILLNFVVYCNKKYLYFFKFQPH